MIFISYKAEEESLALKVRKYLAEEGYRCWIAVLDILGGGNYMSEIPKAINKSDVFLLLLSESSQTSLWIPNELSHALTDRKRIIAINTDGCKLNDEFSFALQTSQIIFGKDRLYDAVQDVVLSLKENGILPEVIPAKEKQKKIMSDNPIQAEDEKPKIIRDPAQNEKVRSTSTWIRWAAAVMTIVFAVGVLLICKPWLRPFGPAITPTTAPTSAPTAAPTSAPTTAPTEAPTAAPTEVPTAAPTEVPTAAPTEVPTAAPTEVPTEAKYFTTVKLADDTLSITGYSGTDNNVIIPEKIDGITVTEIGEDAFRFNSKIQFVRLPDSIQRIGKNAFNKCISLTSINLPDSITEMGGWCLSYCAIKSIELPPNLVEIPEGLFCNCYDMGNVIIPPNVEKIDSFAFYNCGEMTDVSIPSNVTEIAMYAFSAHECKLQNFAVDSENLVYADIDGMLMNKVTGELIQYPCGRTDDFVTIPNCISGIGGGAFENAASLKYVIIPDSVKYIGEDAFRKSGLKEVTIPASVTETTDGDGGIFNFCENLALVVFEGGNTPIASGMFSDCANLASVKLAEGLETISERAFSNCSSLDHITLPSTLKSIEKKAFENCSLTNIKIPSGVTFIDNDAFLGCNNLTL